MFAAIFLFFLYFFFVFFFSKFSDAFRQTSTLYSVWLTFVFLGERYRTSSASLGRACILSYFHQSRGDYLSVPSSSSRGIFIATTKSFAAYEYRRFASLSYYDNRRSCSVLPTDMADDPALSRVLVEDQSVRMYELGKFSSVMTSFPRFASHIGGLATNTTRLLGTFYRRDISWFSYCRFDVGWTIIAARCRDSRV